jgi:hypothetical protein
VIAKWDHHSTNLERLVLDIENGMASAISDGSYKDDNGTSAFLLCISSELTLFLDPHQDRAPIEAN